MLKRRGRGIRIGLVLVMMVMVRLMMGLLMLRFMMVRCWGLMVMTIMSNLVVRVVLDRSGAMGRRLMVLELLLNWN